MALVVAKPSVAYETCQHPACPRFAGWHLLYRRGVMSWRPAGVYYCGIHLPLGLPSHAIDR